MKILLILYMMLVPDKEIYLYRELLQKAEQSAQVSETFFERLKDSRSPNPLVLGYKAMSLFMMSKHVSSPLSKLSYFNQGKTNLEAAIKMDKNNIELTYLRYSVQYNLPAFLGYKSNLQEDKTKIVNYLKSETFEDKDLHARIYNFMLLIKQINVEQSKDVK